MHIHISVVYMSYQCILSNSACVSMTIQFSSRLGKIDTCRITTNNITVSRISLACQSSYITVVFKYIMYFTIYINSIVQMVNFMQR